MAVPAAFGYNTNHTQLLHPAPISSHGTAAPLTMGNANSTTAAQYGSVGAVSANGTSAPSHAWFVPGYVASMGNGSSKGSGGGGEGGVSEMRPQQGGAVNGTGFFVEEEAAEGFSDFQTVILASLATLAPLVALVLGIVAFRICWKYLKRRSKSDNYDGVTDSSCENMEKPLHSHLLNCDKKCSDARLEMDRDDLCDDSSSNTSQMLKGNNHSNTNGSIITMTLKNNHLIVETEERNDIEEDCRETTMRYSPNARDGVFVVEVQQGVRRSPPVAVCTAATVTTSLSDQKQKQHALIHQPPDRFSEESTDTTTQSYTDAQSSASQPTKSPSLLTTVSYAGLATSNQSLSTDVHYSYGNQEEYYNGRYGYPVCSGGVDKISAGPAEEELDDEEATSDCGDRKKFVKQRADSTASTVSYKPKITSAIYKNRASVDLLMDIDHGKLLHGNSLVGKQEQAFEDLDPIQLEQNLLGNSTKMDQSVGQTD